MQEYRFQFILVFFHIIVSPKKLLKTQSHISVCVVASPHNVNNRSIEFSGLEGWGPFWSTLPLLEALALIWGLYY